MTLVLKNSDWFAIGRSKKNGRRKLPICGIVTEEEISQMFNLNTRLFPLSGEERAWNEVGKCLFFLDALLSPSLYMLINSYSLQSRWKVGLKIFTSMVHNIHLDFRIIVLKLGTEVKKKTILVLDLCM